MADSSGASTRLRYASVCDGIGAAHVAWQPLGWQCQWTSEIEPFPVAVVEHHYGFRNLGDMTKITEDMIDAPVDLLVGGTPCQSFSVAGLRGGLADPRGNLALRFVQLAAVMQPRWVVWENVPGVLSSGKGRDFGTFLGALGELGYGFAYRVLDAQWFGVAQRRRRVFVVGYLGDWRRAAAVLFERESVFGNPPTRGAKGEGITSSPQGIAGNVSSKWSKGTGGPAGDECYNLVAFHPTQDPISSEDGLTHALGTGSSGGCATAAVAIGFKQGANYSGACGGLTEECEPPLTCGQDHNLVAFTKSKRAQSVTDDESWVPGEVSPTMSCFDQGDTRATTVVAFRENTRCEVGYVDPPQSLASGGGKAGQGYCGVQVGMAVRRLTPRECERLQGFPDDYTLVTYRGKPACDGPRYRALGNSMAVPVMRWIGERIRMVEGQ